MLDCQLDAEGRPKDKKERVRIKGIREHLEIQRVKQQDKQGPDSWFVRKVRTPSLSVPFELRLHTHLATCLLYTSPSPRDS